MAAAGLTILSEEGAEQRRIMRESQLRGGQQFIWERLTRRRASRPLISSKDKNTKRDQSVAIDILAEEWLGKAQDLSTKLYLAERVLPALVLGLERLLVEVGKKGIEEQIGFRDDFNPVNFLAQQLMRHNPMYRHCVLSQSPYTMGLKMVAAKLRMIALEGEGESIKSKVQKQLEEHRARVEEEQRTKLAIEAMKRDTLREAGWIWSGGEDIPALQVSYHVWMKQEFKIRTSIIYLITFSVLPISYEEVFMYVLIQSLSFNSM